MAGGKGRTKDRPPGLNRGDVPALGMAEEGKRCGLTWGGACQEHGKGPPPGCCSHTDAGAVDGALTWLVPAEGALGQKATVHAVVGECGE